jgi:hypothetical protein
MACATTEQLPRGLDRRHPTRAYRNDRHRGRMAAALLAEQARQQRVPTSYGLKSIASRWHGRGGHAPQILNGAFLMAAHRRGFAMEPQPARYVSKIGRDDCNAWISICSWPDDGNRRPEQRKAG